MVAQRGKRKHARREEQQEKKHLEEEEKKQSGKKTELLCRQRPKTGFILVAAPPAHGQGKKNRRLKNQRNRSFI
jgi:CRISPR/Cas system-associated protein Cas10 (large subunit of type III CRISPR-Cas system)